MQLKLIINTICLHFSRYQVHTTIILNKIKIILVIIIMVVLIYNIHFIKFILWWVE